MRFSRRIFIFLLLVCWPVQAQDSDFPTLDALAKLDVPAYDYVDLARRLRGIESNYRAPLASPKYEIGDTLSFNVWIDQTGGQAPVQTVLRGKTDKLLLWVQESEAFADAEIQAFAEEISSSVLDEVQQLWGYSEPPGIDGDPRSYIVMIRLQDQPLGSLLPAR